MSDSPLILRADSQEVVFDGLLDYSVNIDEQGTISVQFRASNSRLTVVMGAEQVIVAQRPKAQEAQS